MKLKEDLKKFIRVLEKIWNLKYISDALRQMAHIINFHLFYAALQCLTTDRKTGVRSPTEAEDFSSNFCIQTIPGTYRASCTRGTGGPFPGGPVWPGHDADHSPPYSVEVKKVLELYLLSTQASPWCVA
jgi:hypothetical protein